VLKDVLQQTTGLDVLEISGENDWKSTNVTIGKYITNKLYISYEQSFNFDRQSKVIYAEKFMLEYHILRNLILKATNQEINSGFDLIYTKKWR
jgi:autotransporter translocation and assembly factor TamB